MLVLQMSGLTGHWRLTKQTRFKSHSESPVLTPSPMVAVQVWGKKRLNPIVFLNFKLPYSASLLLSRAALSLSLVVVLTPRAEKVVRPAFA